MVRVIGTKRKTMKRFSFDELDIRRQTRRRIFQQGVECLRGGNVVQLEEHTNELRGRVAGSRVTPYRLQVAFEGREVVYGACDCPYDGPGWCKHLVAATLAYLQEGADSGEVITLESVLDGLNAETLKALIAKLSAYNPGLVKVIHDELTEMGEVHADTRYSAITQPGTPEGIAALTAPHAEPAPLPSLVAEEDTADDFYDALGSGWSDEVTQTPLEG